MLARCGVPHQAPAPCGPILQFEWWLRERPCAAVLDRLDTIPGVGRRTAEVIVAEVGPDVRRFPSAGHLASWTGVCPGQD